MEIHRCRFVDYIPSAINALTFTPASTKSLLACGRANGDIEIWNPRNEWNLEKTIPGGTNMSVEALCWTHQTIPEEDETPEETAKMRKKLLAAPPRLFSAGLNALIIEWDTVSLKAKNSVDSHGGAIWCMAANCANTRLAVGCEDGCVRLFDVADGELAYIHSFDGQKGRILSLAWDPSDNFIVTGSSDSSLRKWDVNQGRAISRMTVDKIRREETLVWAVCVLRDGTIVSGDSLGHVKFWDGKLGTMLQTFSCHGADVLCLASDRSGSTVFTSGVDRKCNQFRLVETQIVTTGREINESPSSERSIHRNGQTNARAFTKWILAGNRRLHSHDVRALALEENRPVNSLVSGGVDVSIVVCPAAEFPNTNQRRLPCVPQKPVISLSKTLGLLMCRFSNSIKLWRLGRAASPLQPYTEMGFNAHLDLIEPQQALLEITMKDGGNIIASALSEDCHWIVSSDIDEIKLFRIEDDPSGPGMLKVHKAKNFPQVFSDNPYDAATCAHQLLFTPDSSKLILATSDSYIVVVELSHWQDGGEFEILRRFGRHRGYEDKDSKGDSVEESAISTIISIAVSADGQWLATGDLLNRIHVFNLDTLQHHTILPQFSATHTTLAFHPYSSTLVVPLASNEFHLFDVEAKRLTDWSRENSTNLPKKFLQLKDKIAGVGFNPARRNTLMLWGSTYMCLVDLEKGVHGRDAVNTNKRKRLERHRLEAKKKAAEKRRKRYALLGIPIPEDVSEEGTDAVPSRGKQHDGEGEDDDDVNFQLVHKFQLLMYLDFLGPDTLVVVERPFVNILEKLPPSFYRAKYGT